MAKQDKSGQSLNQIKTSTNIVFNIVFLILAVMCVIPLLFVFSISITDEEAIRQNGYQLVPQALSNAAYEFLWNERLTILRAAFMSVLVTIVGTIISIALNTSMGYVVSRRNFKIKEALHMADFYSDGIQRRYAGKLCGGKQYSGFEQQHLGIDSAPCVFGVQRDDLPHIFPHDRSRFHH